MIAVKNLRDFIKDLPDDMPVVLMGPAFHHEIEEVRDILYIDNVEEVRSFGKKDIILNKKSLLFSSC